MTLHKINEASQNIMRKLNINGNYIKIKPITCIGRVFPTPNPTGALPPAPCTYSPGTFTLIYIYNNIFYPSAFTHPQCLNWSWDKYKLNRNLFFDCVCQHQENYRMSMIKSPATGHACDESKYQITMNLAAPTHPSRTTITILLAPNDPAFTTGFHL